MGRHKLVPSLRHNIPGVDSPGNPGPWYGNGSAFAESLVALWRLDEVSGNRADSVGANTLVDNNTVTSAAGISYPLAAEFVIANSEYLSIVDNAAVSGGDIDMWGGIYVRPAAVNVTSVLMGQFNTTGNQRSYQLAQINADVTLTISPDGTATGTGSVTIAAVLAANTWAAILWYHDAANNLVGLSVDGSAFTTAAYAGGIFDGTAALNLGRQSTGAAYFGGRMQMACLGKGYIPTQIDSTFFLTAT